MIPSTKPLFAAALLAAALLSACSSSINTHTHHHNDAAAGKRSAAADIADVADIVPPDEQLAPLSFMAGGWILKQPHGAIIEEHWTLPRGKSMVAMFHRVLGDNVGSSSRMGAFYEFTQIVAQPEGVFLRQRHVHAHFEVDPKRAEAMLLKLEKVEKNSASFVPVDDPSISHSGPLARISYTLEDPDTLTLKVEPTPDSKDKALEFKMKRIRAGT